MQCKWCGGEIQPSTAARTGGICMRCQRLGPPKPSNIVGTARRHPARCLTAFSTLLAPELEGEGWDSIHIARFRVGCQCGSPRAKILGYNAVNGATQQRLFIAPISLTCPACARTEELFDPRKDGYDAECLLEARKAGHNPISDSFVGMTGGGVPEEFSCPQCGKYEFEPVVSLSYSSDDDEVVDSEMAGRAQDFFDWFSLWAKCAECGKETDVTDYECA